MTQDMPNPDPASNVPDLLSRATAALRDSMIADGPSPELISMTRVALRQDSAREKRNRFFRSAVLRMAALLAIVAGGAWMYHLGVNRGMSLRDRDTSTVALGGTEKPTLPLTAPPTPISIPANLIPHVDAEASRNLTIAEPMLAEGTITGQVLLGGPIPPPVMLTSLVSMPACLKEHGGPIYDESLVVNRNGGVANVVVSISDGLAGWLREEFPPQQAPAVLDQKGCVFVPHVVALMVGQQLLVRNSDALVHNVHLMAINNPGSNLGQPTVGIARTGPFDSPEVFQVQCEVHPWMNAWVRVLDNPYFAVTDAHGRFSIRGLPPGTYTIKAWHEQLGTREQQVTLSPGPGTNVHFTFRARP